MTRLSGISTYQGPPWTNLLINHFQTLPWAAFLLALKIAWTHLASRAEKTNLMEWNLPRGPSFLPLETKNCTFLLCLLNIRIWRGGFSFQLITDYNFVTYFTTLRPSCISSCWSLWPFKYNNSMSLIWWEGRGHRGLLRHVLLMISDFWKGTCPLNSGATCILTQTLFTFDLAGSVDVNLPGWGGVARKD